MELATDLFAELVAGTSRRAVAIVQIGGHAPKPSKLLDLSPTGICVKCSDTALPGDPLVITLPDMAATRLACRVVYCRESGDRGGFSLGAQFVRVLSRLRVRHAA